MGLFDKLKKRSDVPFHDNTPDEELKNGVIEKTPSVVMAIPKDGSALDDIEALLNKLLALPYISVIYKKTVEYNEYGDGFEVCFTYKDEEFKLEARIEQFEMSGLFRVGHQFSEKEIEVMESSPRGVDTKMVFGSNAGESYHLQIKLLCAMIEDPAGIVDFSGERLLSGRWAKLAAASDVPPAPSYLYVIQAVNDSDDPDKDEIWLHTHGLNRCGSVELEILRSDREHCNSHANIINAIGSRIISRMDIGKEFEPIFAARLNDGTPLVATWLTWERAVKMYPKNLLGGAEDRQNNHNEDTGAVYVYASPDDCDAHTVSHVSIYNELIDDNPVIMITSEETARMRRLAAERLGFLKQIFNDNAGKEKFAALVKVGLEVDDEFKDGDMKEHCWFELKELYENSFKAELTHETYYIKALSEGSICECTYDQITDWTVFMSEAKITPDSVYLLTE